MTKTQQSSCIERGMCLLHWNPQAASHVWHRSRKSLQKTNRKHKIQKTHKNPQNPSPDPWRVWLFDGLMDSLRGFILKGNALKRSLRMGWDQMPCRSGWCAFVPSHWRRLWWGYHPAGNRGYAGVGRLYAGALADWLSYLCNISTSQYLYIIMPIYE